MFPINKYFKFALHALEDCWRASDLFVFMFRQSLEAIRMIWLSYHGKRGYVIDFYNCYGSSLISAVLEKVFIETDKR